MIFVHNQAGLKGIYNRAGDHRAASADRAFEEKENTTGNCSGEQKTGNVVVSRKQHLRVVFLLLSGNCPECIEAERTLGGVSLVNSKV